MSIPTYFSRYARSRSVHVVCAVLFAMGVSSLAVASSELSTPSIADSSDTVVRKTRVASPERGVDANTIEDGSISPQTVSGGYTFVPINPYRAMDTRIIGGQPLRGGESEYFSALLDMDGNQQIPSDAVAVTYNLTAAETTGPGFLAIYPADIFWPGTSAINWSTSVLAVANGGTIAIGEYQGDVGAVEILLDPPGSSAHYILDITGYYF